ncbi:TonB-dependent receptor [Chryseolinea sp. T2]|uniref:SusC/RagA family TonB-linked outer membrane protein n=1 Tax=Chryseolinea sp. T2 TaxID=3129255 RepID=UPI0030773653
MNKTSTRKFINATLCLFLGVWCCLSANVAVAGSPDFNQQQKEVSGKITEASTGEPLPGATVQIKGTTLGTITDAEGAFSLTVADNATTLVVSFLGYKTVELAIGANTTFNVALENDATSLEEVVVVGYQTMRKSDVTGAIASVKASELNRTTPTVGQALVGKVAGVQISQVTGAPYKSTKIRVRGTSSINASSDPLYVIDGYPQNGDLFINMEDVESIEVLKDAASAAIYGSRASGGVILITTKRGKEGKPTVTYDYQFGVNQLSRKVDLLNAHQFYNLFVDAHNKTYKDLVTSQGKPWNDNMVHDDNATRTAYTNNTNANTIRIPEYMYDFASGTIKEPEFDTDWQDELYRNGINNRHNLSVIGGRDGVRYAVSGGFQDQQGIVRNTGLKKYNLRSNVDIDLSKKIAVGASLAYTDTESREVTEGRFQQSPVMAAMIYLPFLRAYNDDGTPTQYGMSSQSADYAFQSDIENPVAYVQQVKNYRETTRATYNVYGQYKIIDPLVAKLSFGTYNYTDNWEYYRPTSITSGTFAPYSPQAITAANARNVRTDERDYLTEFTLNYNKKINAFGLSGVIGASTQSHKIDVMDVTANGFTDDKVPYVFGGGADPSNFTRNPYVSSTNGTGITEYAMASAFGRVNVSYLDRYHITATFRGDGSSLFGPENRWAYFPSVSGGWTASDEQFYKSLFGERSTLKLRASWGRSGNNGIGAYNYQQVMGKTGVVIGNSVVTATYPGAFRDNTLGWESTSQTNVGIDLGLFDGRLSLIANWYDSYTFNLLFSRPITAVSGSTTMLTNLPDSRINNRGFDIQLDGVIASAKDYEVKASGNFSVNRNEVLDLGGASTIITNGAERSYLTHITQEGQPIGMFYGFKVAGMVQTQEEADAMNAGTGHAPSAAQSTKVQPGDLYFEDTDGNGIVNDNDKTVIGNPYPKFIYALNLSARYKNFDISASANGVQGNKVLDGQNYYNLNMEGSGNQYAVVDERFRTPDDPGNGDIYRAARGGTQSNSTRLSTFYLNDGSFLRITNVTLGYNWNTAAITNNTIANIRFYVSTDNLYTFQKYRGYNPEVDYNNGANLTPGVDYGKYPLMRSFNAGVRVQF